MLTRDDVKRILALAAVTATTVVAVMILFLNTVFADAPTYRPPRIATAPEAPTSPFTWTGAYAGAGIGIGITGGEDVYNSFERDTAGDVRIGFDWQPMGPIVVGLLGGYDFDFGGNRDDQWYIGPRLGLAFASGTLLYGAATWNPEDFDQNPRLLLGLEQVLPIQSVTLGIEYGYQEVTNIIEDHTVKFRFNVRPGNFFK